MTYTSGRLYFCGAGTFHKLFNPPPRPPKDYVDVRDLLSSRELRTEQKSILDCNGHASTLSECAYP